jgi:predicted O-methyltransferase YrrM
VNFSGDAVAAVFDEYERRADEEREVMAAMAPGEGYSRRDEFLLPVGREAAWFLHSLVIARKPSIVLELGTSYGYSTLFLADAVTQCGGRLITMEIADYKQDYAREMIAKAGLTDNVDFHLGDAVAMIGEEDGPFDLVLLDIWKDLYVPCFEALYPKLSDEGIIAADNMIEPEIARPEVREYRTLLHSKPDLQTTLLPIGSGIELSCRWPANSGKL